jgi:hypothetical protein
VIQFKHIFLLILSLLINEMAFAQEDVKSSVVQQRIEFISEQLESESIDLTDVVEQLNYYYDHPLNLNSATFEELQDLNLLSDIQINNLLLHIKQFGKFISIYEIQSLNMELSKGFSVIKQRLNLKLDIKMCQIQFFKIAILIITEIETDITHVYALVIEQI